MLLLLLIAGMLATALPAGGKDSDRAVRSRVAAMYAAQAALERLGEMSGGRRRFDAAEARAARRDLIALMRDIPARFRRQRMDDESRAQPEIWQHWRQFKGAARQAERAARGLRTGSLNRLRQGLPAVLGACLGCHRSYREPP